MNNGKSDNTAKPFLWTHEYLIKLLSTGKDPILTDPIYLNAFRAIDRKHFTPEEFHNDAYRDRSIPIGFEEEMTSPVVLAREISALAPRLGGKYLQLGTGSGYLAALLSFIVGRTGQVYSLERLQWLWQQARKNLEKYPALKSSLSVLYRDGMEGLMDKAPYEGIVVSYALDEIPDVLLHQLLPGGKIVYPGTDLNLYVAEKGIDNELETEVLTGVLFKPAKSGLA